MVPHHPKYSLVSRVFLVRTKAPSLVNHSTAQRALEVPDNTVNIFTHSLVKSFVDLTILFVWFVTTRSDTVWVFFLLFLSELLQIEPLIKSKTFLPYVFGTGFCLPERLVDIDHYFLGCVPDIKRAPTLLLSGVLNFVSFATWWFFYFLFFLFLDWLSFNGDYKKVAFFFFGGGGQAITLAGHKKGKRFLKNYFTVVFFFFFFFGGGYLYSS